MSAASWFDTAGHAIELPCSPVDGPDLESRYEQRERDLWQDLEVLAEEITQSPALEYRGKHVGPGYMHPAVRIGTPALTAFRDGDAVEFFRLVSKAVKKQVRERAETEIDDEEN